MCSGKKIQSLHELPGVGERVAEKLKKRFGSEASALKAIFDGDLAALSGINGISQAFALSLVREAKAKNEGVSISDFLKTKEAFEIYSRLLKLIQSFAHTSYAQEKLSLFYPYPAAQKTRIEKRRALLFPYLKIAKTLEQEATFPILLTKVRQLKAEPETLWIRDRIILTSDPEALPFLKEKFGAFLSIQAAESLSEFVDLGRGYSHVIVFDDTFLGFDLPAGLEPEFFSGGPEKVAFWQIVPEKELAFFARNLSCIKACLGVLLTLRAQGFEIFDTFTTEEGTKLEELLEKLNPSGELTEGFDPEIDRLKTAQEALDSKLSLSLEAANKRFGELLEKSSVTLRGEELLRLANGDLEIRELLKGEVQAAYKKELRKLIEELSENLRLEGSEKLLLERLFPGEINYPLSPDSRGLQLLRQTLAQKLEEAKFIRKRELAKALFASRPAIETLVKAVLDFDLGFSIGCFSQHFGLSMPKLSQKAGIGFEAGENLFLKAKYGKVSPINYSLGKTSFSQKGLEERVVLLSGVNSGGKTSLLELLAQCVILGNMGFPVPALTLELGPVDEFYYFGKSNGTLDAGAFETTLKQFSVLADRSSKLVLADELESITEPGASARIIAGILELLVRDEQSLGIFVSHLSELILKNTKAKLRVDGIEAQGLDSELELIVNRTPIYSHIAKSTPELIVERLLRKTSGKEKEFYELLRSKF